MKPLVHVLWRLPGNLLGLLCLVFALALLASFPILNFLAFGYLLEAAGRTARSGKWRDGIFGIRQARIVGAVAIVGWFLVLPIRFITSLWTDATLLGGSDAPSLTFTSRLLTLLGIGLAGATVAGLLFAGARHARAGTETTRTPFLVRARDGLLGLIAEFQLPKLFFLGLRGWVGGVLWLAPPVAVLLVAARLPSNAAVLVAGSGILLMVPVATTLPLVQARFAATGHWRDLFDRPAQRRVFRSAPWACLLSVSSTLAAALPLLLPRVELPPRDLAWLPALVFVALLWPAKILAGWAVHRGEYLAGAAPLGPLRTLVPRLLLLMAGLAYGLGLWTSQYLDWHGTASFLEQHAFLLPAPARAF